MYGPICWCVSGDAGPESFADIPCRTAIFVGTAREMIPELIERAKGLKVTGGFEKDADL